MTSYSGYRLDIQDWDTLAHFELNLILPVVRFQPTTQGIKNQQTYSGKLM